jgi:hypothetical protein
MHQLSDRKEYGFAHEKNPSSLPGILGSNVDRRDDRPQKADLPIPAFEQRAADAPKAMSMKVITVQSAFSFASISRSP